MSRLLHRASRRYLSRHPTQLLLAVLGVALGVSVMVSIDVASRSAQRAFELSSAAVTGRATHRIVGGPRGVPERYYRELRVDRRIRSIAPIVEGWVDLPDRAGRAFRLLGIDPLVDGEFRSFLDSTGESTGGIGELLTRPGAVLLSPSAAAELALVPGDELVVRALGRPQTLHVTGVLAIAEDIGDGVLSDLAIADVATVQELLGMEGYLSRIEVLSETRRPSDLLDGSGLPPGLRVESASDDAETAAQMTRAFRLNLQALSLLALLCGSFLIYNTMTFAVVQRRALLGLLRAVGTTRRQILRVVLVESASIGLLGSLLGAFGGVFLGRYLVGLVTRTINDLYFTVQVREIALEPAILVKAGVLGLGTSLLAAVVPALEAASVAPRAALARSELEERALRWVPRLGSIGLMLALLGVSLLVIPLGSLIPAFAALFTLLIGMALLAPAATLILMRLIGPPVGLVFGRTGLMATRGVVRSLSRSGVAIAALMMAVSVAVGVDLMVGSFRGTVNRWLDYALPADLYASFPSSISSRFAGPQSTFDPSQVRDVRSRPGVDRVDTVRHFEVATTVGVAQAVAIDVGDQGRSAYRFVEGDPNEIWEEVGSGDGILVSEPFAHRYGLGIDDRLGLQTPGGLYEPRIAGVFYGYATERGLCLLAGHVYRRLWGDDSVTALAIHLEPGFAAGAAKEEIQSALGEQRGVLVRSHAELRRDSLVVFDRTFLVTGVLKTLAVIVAFVGVLSALLALGMERAREMAVLRACGLTPGELWRLVIQQTGLMGLTAGLLSLPVGLGMAAIMIHVINRRAFGWSLDMEVDPAVLAAAVGVSLASGLLAGLYPAYRMAGTSPAEALREE